MRLQCLLSTFVLHHHDEELQAPWIVWARQSLTCSLCCVLSLPYLSLLSCVLPVSTQMGMSVSPCVCVVPYQFSTFLCPFSYMVVLFALKVVSDMRAWLQPKYHAIFWCGFFAFCLSVLLLVSRSLLALLFFSVFLLSFCYAYLRLHIHSSSSDGY